MSGSRGPPRTPSKASGIQLSQLVTLPTYVGTSTHRLQSLYADFTRQKHSNPTSYTSNVDWWRRTLQEVVARGLQPDCAHRLVLSAAPPLPEAFRYEGVGKPLALGTVVAELTSTRALIPLNHFLASAKSVYDPGWLPWRIASYVVGKPLWWALQQTGLVDTDDGGHESDAQRWRRVKGEYVTLALVEDAAEAVIRHWREMDAVDLADALFSFDGFRRVFGAVVAEEGALSDTDLKVLIKYLERDRQVIVSDKEIIKFVDADAPPEAHSITAVDRGILELKTAVESLQAQVNSLQAKIDDKTAKISDALRQKRKELALSHLRARKQYEELMRKRLGSLETLQGTLISVETAAGDVEIMQSYTTSTATLRTLLAHPSLQRDTVDATLDALATANADARDIDDTVRAGGELAAAQAGLDIDDAELDAELATLAAEAEREKAAERELRMLDERTRVPEGAPGHEEQAAGAEEHDRPRTPVKIAETA